MKITKKLKECLLDKETGPIIWVKEKRTNADEPMCTEQRNICMVMANPYNTGREVTIDFRFNRKSVLYLVFDLKTGQFVCIDDRCMGKQIKTEQATGVIKDIICAIEYLKEMGFLE